LLDDRKLGGILIESTAAKAVCGIGINLAWAPPGAAQLNQRRDEVFERLRARLDVWASASPEAVLARWRALSATLGRRVRIDVAGQITEGVAEGIGPHGELIVDGVPFVAGSVTHL
jgi:BirA family biotin operon repressor/biotin-[acetyl-CoA-carboxylase] ligase